MNNQIFVSSKLFHSFTKLLFCLLASAAVSLALFLFMQRLVNQPVPTLPKVEFSGFVELFRPTPETPIEERQPEPQQQVSEPEPQQQSLNLLNQTDSKISLPDSFEFTADSLLPGFSTDTNASNVQIAQKLLEDFGEDTQQGFIEITPFATRRPNIPDVAYQNQLNGWVLVIFNVSPAGKPHSIKILDASPKGIFEEEVIKAIKHWRYDARGIAGNAQDVIMTQKIELNWQNYPQNLSYDE